jgi:hypothetical protein
LQNLLWIGVEDLLDLRICFVMLKESCDHNFDGHYRFGDRQEHSINQTFESSEQLNSLHIRVSKISLFESDNNQFELAKVLATNWRQPQCSVGPSDSNDRLFKSSSIGVLNAICRIKRWMREKK